MSKEAEPEVKQEQEDIDFSEFLESTPPSGSQNISKLTEPIIYRTRQVGYRLLKPEIKLHCPDDSCNGTRFFRCIDDDDAGVSGNNFEFFFMTYECSNCRRTEKTFALAAKRDSEANSGQCYKLGESPAYGPPTPSQLISLIGPDREIFLKGRRCETQGLGIGAFSYYRRVVENQKNRILDKIIQVANKLKVDDGIVATLEAAKTETQFSKALASVSNAIPDALLIDGRNPLTLLHSALSDGLHDKSDEHCLEIAHGVRLVLGELSERIAQTLKDKAELKNALSTLMEAKGKG